MTRNVLLTENWRFLGTEANAATTPPEASRPDWRPAVVPGDINADLLRYGDIPDPKYDTDAKKCYWVSAKDWWYRTTFDIDRRDGESVELVFETLDGTADVFLNGRELGTAANAFRPWRFAVGEFLKPKDNQLCLRFRSIDRFFGEPREDELAGWPGKRAFLRKPQFCFGWDWALPLPSIGVGGQVRLEIGNRLKLTDFSVKPFADGRVDFAFEVSKETRLKGYEISIKVTGHGEAVSSRLSRLRGVAVTGHGADGGETLLAPFKCYRSIVIPNPKLWYPNGFGEAALYDYDIQLIVAGKTVDARTGKLGLRESKIVERPFDGPFGDGFSFHIAINGEEIFCKGSNWVPPEIWPATATEEQYRFYLRQARDAGFNMLRLWGGGIYERDIFYDLCDEYGIMIWQDFMFASTGYPFDFHREEIIKEATYQIKRLRNRPSVVLWCGCNEDVYSWKHPLSGETGAQEDSGVFMSKNAGGDTWAIDRYRDDPRLYSMTLRGLVGLLGLDVPYIESSPASRDDYGNIPSSGNCHISAWKFALFQADGRPENFRRHFEQVCSFNSEFCDQGPCSVAAFKRFFRSENLWPPNDAWIYHVQRGHKNLPHHEQTLTIAGGIFGPINSLEDYVKFGQATHLEMTRAEFEAARRDRPNCGGTMSWMFNDCWPTANWSIIDYYRTPKPAYYASKRGCAPVLAIIMERGGAFEFFVDNQTPKRRRCRITFGAENLAGIRTLEKTLTLDVPANRAVLFYRIERKDLASPLDAYCFIDLEIGKTKAPRQIYFPNGWKDVPWPAAPRISVKPGASREIEPDHWETKVRITTDAFVRLCHLAPTDTDAGLEFSDNYFDLPAGGERQIVVRAKRKIGEKDLTLGHWRGRWF